MSLVTGNNSIDSLVYSSWANTANTPVHLTYSFMTAAPFDASADDARGFRAMTAGQQDAAREALAKWAGVANIVFTEVGSGGNIQLGTNNQGNQSSGYAYLPDGHNPAYLYTNNRDSFNSDFTPGTYGPTVLMHEIGHTLGFKHPGNYDSTGTSIDGPFLPAATDNGDYTLMSYNANSGYNDEGKYDVTPMLYDIQAMQHLYGANMTYHTGNDTYSFVAQSAPQCIWDAGGTDTMDFSACPWQVVINLNAGSFSSTSPGYGNVSIAYNVTIEQAVAGNGGSAIYCNDAGDKITGGAGADVVTEGGGSDIIIGGDGSDTVIFGGRAAHYVLSNTGAGLTVSGDGIDILTGIEFLKFADATITVDTLPLLVKPVAVQSAHTTVSFSLDLDNQVFSNANGGSALVLSVTQANGDAVPGWLKFNQQTGILTGTPGQGDVGALSLRVSASNGYNVSVIDDFKLTVTGFIAQGGPGNDALSAGDGDQNINGGGGIDTLYYSGARNGYTVAASDSTIKVTDLAGKGGVDTLTAVERIEFSDGGLALDTNGEAGQLYRLYGAMFDRLPDDAGMGFWLVKMDNGMDLVSIARGFINSPEFVRTYGEQASSELFVTSLYSNVLHRAPDQAGFDVQLAALNHGMSREQLLVNFSDSAENIGVFSNLHLVGVNYAPWAG